MPSPLHSTLLVVGLLLVSCKSAREHQLSADEEVYAILEARRADFAVTGERPFDIAPPADSLRQRILAGAAPELGPLSLVETLEIASENSRQYQRQKEQLYLTALDLTLARYGFQIQTSGTLGAALIGQSDEATTADADGGFTLTRLLGSGAFLVGQIGTSLTKDLLSGNGWDAVTNISLSITQPLLRGFGQRIVLEPLTQAERNVVYQVRSFERFRHTFAVDVAGRYYRLLQQVDTVGNEESNFDNLKVLRERNEQLAIAGRLSDIQVDQALQDELRSKNRLIQEQQRLEGQLDDFKLFLGLPIDAPLELDPAGLEGLESQALAQIELEAGELIAIAMRERLDYLTALDRVDDTARRLAIAEDDLRASLDVTSSVGIASRDGQAGKFDGDDLTWTLGLDVDLPIDRLRERNVYREALINLDLARRDAEELADSIEVDLRDSLRTAAQTLETWRIQLNAVELAERRVESTNLNLDAGRADTRDILEAQEALLEARNAATQALIDYHLSTLALYRDLEVLRIGPDGIFVEEELLDPTADLTPSGEIQP